MLVRGSRIEDAKGQGYTLDTLLGSGGQGSVWSLSEPGLAAKLLNPTHKPNERERLKSRVLNVRRLPLDHLQVVRPLEVLAGEFIGYTMELADDMAPVETLGPQALATMPRGTTSSVEWYVATGGLRRRLEVLAGAARALSDLHSCGFAFGDVSRTNILYSSGSSDTSTILLIDVDNIHIDFSDKRALLTRGYAAPELVAGRSFHNSLTDAYSLSVLIFEVLCLIHPFIGDSVDDNDPEFMESAYRGELPWVDDPLDRSNEAVRRGIARKWVLSPVLRDLFQEAFGSHHSSLGTAEAPALPRVVRWDDPASSAIAVRRRPGIGSWASRLTAASGATVICPNVDCGWSYYRSEITCPKCQSPRPKLILGQIMVFDPSDRRLVSFPDPNGSNLLHPRPVQVVTVGPGETRTITRRQVFGGIGRHAEEPVLSIRSHFDDVPAIQLRSLDGDGYEVQSGSGTVREFVTTREWLDWDLTRRRGWRVHFYGDDQTRIHRVIHFAHLAGAR